MPRIHFIDRSGQTRTVEAEIGSTVMHAAIKHHIPGIDAECGGACACATCHVYVDEAWMAKLPPASATEFDMIDYASDVKPTSRLSCQIKITADVDGLTVRIPERQG